MSKRSVVNASQRLLVPILAFTIGGCGDDECGGSVAAQACCDFVDAWADVCFRCEGGTREECDDFAQEGVEAELGDEGCRGAVRIRDEESFYDECLPELELIACDEVAAGGFPSSCRDQILYYE